MKVRQVMLTINKLDIHFETQHELSLGCRANLAPLSIREYPLTGTMGEPVPSKTFSCQSDYISACTKEFFITNSIIPGFRQTLGARLWHDLE